MLGYQLTISSAAPFQELSGQWVIIAGRYLRKMDTRTMVVRALLLKSGYDLIVNAFPHMPLLFILDMLHRSRSCNRHTRSYAPYKQRCTLSDSKPHPGAP
jgi:hypothetical protein